MSALLLLLASYLLGSIPFGLIIGKLWASVDVREHGSGNIGTTNVLRTLGKGPAAVVLVLDLLKGALPVVAAQSFGLSDWIVAAAGLAAVAGHVWSAFLRFNGGKGIATALGVAVAFDLRLALALLTVWILVVFVTRYISVASLAGALCMPVFLWAFGHGTEYVSTAAVISLLAFWRHRSNLSRLLAGTEYRFGERASARIERR